MQVSSNVAKVEERRAANKDKYYYPDYASALTTMFV